jgi:hypothetical protein
LQDEVLRLTKELRQTHRENNAAEIIRSVVGQVTTFPRGTIQGLGDTTRPRGKPTPEVPIIGWADIHAGEVVEPSEVHGFNAYNMAIAEERFTRAVDKGYRAISGAPHRLLPRHRRQLRRRHGLWRLASRTSQDG